MRLDKDTKDVMRELFETKCFDRHDRSLDISLFLDKNNKLDLWGLEVAIRGCTKFLFHIATSSMENPVLNLNLTYYFNKRHIDYNSAKGKEEFDFVEKFANRIIDDELTG